MHAIEPLNAGLAVIGMAVMLLVKFDTIRKEKGIKFSLKYWIKDNWIKCLITLKVIIVLFLCQDYIEPVLGVTFNPLNSFFAGYGCQDLTARLLAYTPFKK